MTPNRSCRSICEATTNVHERRSTSWQHWSTGLNLKMTSLTSKTSPGSWRISSHRTRSEICHLMTGKGWEVNMMSQKSRVEVFFCKFCLEHPNVNICSVLVHHVALQQTLWKKSRRSEAFLPQDHLQVANFWFCLFWSEGKLFLSSTFVFRFWKTKSSF